MKELPSKDAKENGREVPSFADLLLAFPGESGDLSERRRKRARSLDERATDARAF